MCYNFVTSRAVRNDGQICPFNPSNNYLLSTFYVSGTVLGAWVTEMNNSRTPCPRGFYSPHFTFTFLLFTFYSPHSSESQREYTALTMSLSCL